jgi:Tol biopolymer transport system component
VANNVPAWTPDGKRIAFLHGASNMYWQLADGSGGLERLTDSEYLHAPMSFSSDGQRMAYIESNPTTGYDIWVMRMNDPSAPSGQAHKAEPFIRTPFNESAPQFSPDGHWLAYVSNESGRNEIYVVAYPGPGGKWQISTEGGTEPVWNRNGRELFFRDASKMMAVDVAAQASFAAGKPHMLFEGPYAPTPATFPNYDVSLDGQRFLMLKPVEQARAAPAQINVVLNWFEELKQKVPTGKN